MSKAESTSASPPSESHAYDGQRTEAGQSDMPSSLDGKPHARQKRKRTSPEDQEILEAAYKLDPKPDKTARLGLVERVSLGEKEVQIWFQNRRQSSRRRSRPLLPHEVAEYHQSRAGASSSAIRSSQDADGLVRYESGVDSEESRHESPDPSTGSDVSDANAVKTEDGMPTNAAPTSTLQTPQDAQPGIGTPLPSVPTPYAAPSNLSSSVSSAQGVRAPVGYIANRRSMSSLRQSFPGQSPPASSWPERSSDRRIKRVSSCVRLSMNAEGKAEIITKDASSPSPPRPKQTMMLPDVTLNHTTTPNFSASQGSSHGLQRSASGRSRDSRSWEFWCDKEARSELETAAEKNASGSAAGAIGLLRTASGRNILGSMSGKRNSAFANHTSSAKRSKLGQRKPLQRASTSLGRLQGKHGHGGASLPKLKHSGSSTSLHIKGNDSDKENWSPGRDLDSDDEEVQLDDQPGRRDVAAQRHSRSKIVGGRTQSQNDGNDPEADAELAEFMRGGGRGGDDLDCVQGLLSLSQGNWK